MIEVFIKWEFVYCVLYCDIGWICMEMGVLIGWFCVVSYILNVFVVELVMDEVVYVVKCDLVEFWFVYMYDWLCYVVVLWEVVWCVGWG